MVVGERTREERDTEGRKRAIDLVDHEEGEEETVEDRLQARCQLDIYNLHRYIIFI